MLLLTIGLGFSLVLLLTLFFQIKTRTSTLRDPISVWNSLSRLGRFRPKVYSLLLGFVNPYTRGIHLRITTIDKGLCSGVLKEQKRIHNPFDSIHAASLCLFGETIIGLAVFSQLGKKDRAIVNRINCEYYKKARGLITATCSFKLDYVRRKEDRESFAILKNEKLETVAKITVNWTIENRTD
ncbi:hypothetical protein G9A89_018512 [Geosiphon pyriformis]|nr:hypothetical protein G9A89_018512 [Geosiphon pyriformis]